MTFIKWRFLKGTSSCYRRYLIGIIVTLGLLIKVIYVSLMVGLDASPANADAAWNNAVACNILAGQGYANAPGHPTASKPPLYPLFLAAVYALTGRPSLAVARITMLLLLSTLPLWIYFIGRREFGSEVGLLGAFFVALDPLMAFLSGIMLADGLLVTLTVIFIWLLQPLEKQPKWIRAAFAGIVFGLMALTKGSLLTLVPFLILWAWRKVPVGQRLRIAFAVLGVAFLVVLPWTIRNFLVYKEFILLDTHMGGTIWGATNPLSEGKWIEPSQHPEIYRLPRFQGLGEVEQDREALRAAIEWAWGHPLDFAILEVRKVIRLYHFYSFTIRPEKQRLYWVVGLLSYGVLLPFILLGFLLAIRERKAWLPLSVIGAITLTALIFYGDVRMRAPAQPFLFLLAAYGMWRAVLGLISTSLFKLKK